MEKPHVLKPYYRLMSNGKPVRVAREGYMGCYVYLNETDIIPNLKITWLIFTKVIQYSIREYVGVPFPHFQT